MRKFFVCIDIGTSTTQVVFTRLTAENKESTCTIPQKSEIIYRSAVHFTPLRAHKEIDMPMLQAIVEQEFLKSGVHQEDVNTGAVVLTGDSARNSAPEILRCLSKYAGNFIKSDGLNQEGIIAARGACTDVYSREHQVAAANYDIGGKTTNIALYQNGELLSTGCLDIGGRLVQVQDGRLANVSPKIAALMQTKGISLAEGEPADLKLLQSTVQAMTELLEMSMGLREKSEFYPTMLTLPGRDIELPAALTHISFSGGVADAIYGVGLRDNGEDPFRFGDIGILLGQAIADSSLISSLCQFRVGETIWATAIGAGSHFIHNPNP